MAQVRHGWDKKWQHPPSSPIGPKKILFDFNMLNKMNGFGIENAINKCKVQ